MTSNDKRISMNYIQIISINNPHFIQMFLRFQLFGFIKMELSDESVYRQFL